MPFSANVTMLKRIKGVIFNELVLIFDIKIPFGALNLGLLRFEREGRTFELDTVLSNWFQEETGTEVFITLDVDEEVSENCKFDLLKKDLLKPDLKCELWLEEAIELANGKYSKPIEIYLKIRIDEKEHKIPVTF